MCAADLSTHVLMRLNHLIGRGILVLHLSGDLLPRLVRVDLSGDGFELAHRVVELLPCIGVQALGVVRQHVLLLEHQIVRLLANSEIALGLLREIVFQEPDETRHRVARGAVGLQQFVLARRHRLRKCRDLLVEDRQGPLSHEQAKLAKPRDVDRQIAGPILQPRGHGFERLDDAVHLRQLIARPADGTRDRSEPQIHPRIALPRLYALLSDEPPLQNALGEAPVNLLVRRQRHPIDAPQPLEVRTGLRSRIGKCLGGQISAAVTRSLARRIPR